jgi:hypothetical protein
MHQWGGWRISGACHRFEIPDAFVMAAGLGTKATNWRHNGTAPHLRQKRRKIAIPLPIRALEQLSSPGAMEQFQQELLTFSELSCANHAHHGV